jgi:hypothetical protein
MGFSQKAYINPMITNEVIQLHLSALHTIRFPAG